VLGASTFNFLVDFGIGSRITDVTELQKILLAGGHLKIAAPTGYFGALSLAAVKSYQKAHGVIQTGYVGPLTRGELNKGSLSTSTGSKLNTSQASAVVGFIQAFGADADIIANVRAALGF
jgi:peptidoglycan hydrolase-like protein with peptidoglycan-binding domain